MVIWCEWCTNDSSYKADAASFHQKALCLAETSLSPTDDAYLTLMASVSYLLRLDAHKELHAMYEGHFKNLMLSLGPLDSGEYTRYTTFVQLMSMNFPQTSLQ